MVDFPAKRAASEAKVLPSPITQRPYNHVDEEMTTRLQNVPREIRKSVTEGYRIPLPPSSHPHPQAQAQARPGDKQPPIFRSHRDDITWTLDLISPETVRSKELRPLYERLERSGSGSLDGQGGEGGALFSLPTFPGKSGQRKRRMERETSPSSSAGNSPASSPVPGLMQLDGTAAEADVDMDLDSAPFPLSGRAIPPPPVPLRNPNEMPDLPAAREIRPQPRRRLMKNVQSAPAGGLKFGAGAWAAAGAGVGGGLADVDDEPWREVDFSTFAREVPE